MSAVDLPVDWSKADWFRKGYRYPHKDIPPQVVAARQAVLALPPSVAKLLPNEETPVAALLDKEYPIQLSTYVWEHASAAFSPLEPNEMEANWAHCRAIPPHSWITSLEQGLPLYAISYWKAMDRVWTERRKWEVAECWLTKWEKKPRNIPLVDAVRECLMSLKWTGEIRALGGGGNVGVQANRARRDESLATTVVIGRCHLVGHWWTRKIIPSSEHQPSSLDHFSYRLQGEDDSTW